MDKFHIERSLKDIPNPSEAEYLEYLIEKVAKCMHNFLWDAFFKLNENKEANNNVRKNTFGFRSGYAPPPINRKNYGEYFEDIKKFVASQYEIPRKVKFKHATNKDQAEIKEILERVNKTDKLIISADKTRNHYLMDPDEYQKKLLEEITSEYKKAPKDELKKVNSEHARIAAELKLDDRMEIYRQNECFLTIKDHKEGFNEGVVKCRLINPAKSDLGVVSKQILEKKINQIMEKTGLNSWQSTGEALCWFENLAETRPGRSRKMRFLSYDIVGYYPAIKEKVLEKAIEWAKEFCDFSDQELEIIYQARETFLIHKGEPWTTKDGNGNFAVAIGGFDSCQLCELVGLYLLSEVSKIVPQENHGIYRDDGLIVLEGNGQQFERIRQKLVKIFKENGFKLECVVRTKQVEFLDVKLDISTKQFRPYRKPNDYPCYISKGSNHPPTVINKLPDMINKRINDLSCNEEVFHEEKVMYQAGLNRSGFNDYRMKYLPKPEERRAKKKKARSRKVIWFNPPWAMNVKTPVGKYFRQAIQKFFPPEHPLSKFYNKNTLKISYCTTKNLGAHIAAHNRRILQPAQREVPRCNCKNKFKPNCPLPGKCTVSNVVYQADVITTDRRGRVIKTYFGQTKREFKLRYREHMQAFKNENSPHATALSNYVWKLKRNGQDYTIRWSIKYRAPPYKSGSKKCLLCLKEKTAIALCDPKTLLNTKSELLKKCIHHINVELRKHR